MYSIFPRGAFWALWVVAGWAVSFLVASPALAEVDNDETVAANRLGAPLVFGGTETTPRDDTPPAPIAAPVTGVTVMPDHLVDVQKKLRDHPGQRRARRRAIEGVRPEDKPRAPKTLRRPPA